MVAIAIMFSSLPDLMITEIAKDGAPILHADKTSIFHFPHLFLGVLALFLIVGVEVMAGDLIIGYGKSLGIALSTARYLTPGYTWLYVGWIYYWH